MIAIGRANNIAGQVFGRLTALNRAENQGGYVRWDCSCSCGEFLICRADRLRIGDTRSCGCLRSETTAAMNRAGRRPQMPQVASGSQGRGERTRGVKAPQIEAESV